MKSNENAPKKRKFNRTIQGKLIWTYLFIVGVIAVISVSFVTVYMNTFINSSTLRKLEKAAFSFSRYHLADTLFSETTADMLYSQVIDENYSVVILDADGEYYNSRNIDAVKAGLDDDFSSELTEAFSPYLMNNEAFRVRFNSRPYGICVRPVTGYLGETVGYIVLIAPLSSLALNVNLINLYVISVSVASILAILLAAVLSQTMTTNIRQLRKKAECIANREFDVDVPMRITNDEIGELAVSIDEMSRSIQEYDHNQKIFLQNASHELRTPLMSIRGYVEGIKDGVFDNTDEVSDEILNQVDRLEKLVNEVIYLSKIETAEGMLKFGSVSIEDIVTEAVSRVSGIAIANNINIKVAPIPDITITADGDNLALAITNIMSNCLRYAKSEIYIEVMALDRLVVRVSDDGNGINPADLPHLFKRFYKGRKGNFGLGLSIVKAIVDAHKGSIYVYNKTPADGEDTPRGAVFEIALPYKK